MATVSGIWVWNDTVKFSNESWIYQSVNFYSDGKSCREIGFVKGPSSSQIVYYLVGQSQPVTAFTAGWRSQAYKTIDFGEEQTVDDAFYTALTSNATKLIAYDLLRLDLTGTHSITVKARGTGYIASPASNAVEYSV